MLIKLVKGIIGGSGLESLTRAIDTTWEATKTAFINAAHLKH